MGWAVLLTQPNRERTAHHHACEQGFDCWLPQVRVTYPRVRLEPLFPRYAFVWIVDAWRVLLSTRGVSDILRSRTEGEPLFVTQDEIDRLREREREGIVVLPPRQRFVPGETVRVNDGPFSGFNGLFEGMLGEERAEVLVTMFGRETRVCMAEAALSAV